MAKKRHWKTEYSVFLLFVFGVLALLMPVSIENTRQANFISKWNEKFNRVQYMFSVIEAHVTDDMLLSLKNAKTPNEKEDVLLLIIKPYLRINNEKIPKRYKLKYMNGARVYKGQTYFFDEFYFAENNSVVGLKNVEAQNPDAPYFMMMFDINGTLPPNRWGVDVFGVDIYDGKIEPFGFDKSMDDLRKDCSKSGTGVYCSYFYKIGGGFSD